MLSADDVSLSVQNESTAITHQSTQRILAFMQAKHRTNRQIHNFIKSQDVFDQNLALRKASYRNACQDNRADYREFCRTAILSLPARPTAPAYLQTLDDSDLRQLFTRPLAPLATNLDHLEENDLEGLFAEQAPVVMAAIQRVDSNEAFQALAGILDSPTKTAKPVVDVTPKQTMGGNEYEFIADYIQTEDDKPDNSVLRVAEEPEEKHDFEIITEAPIVPVVPSLIDSALSSARNTLTLAESALSAWRLGTFWRASSQTVVVNPIQKIDESLQAMAKSLVPRRD